ncbi:Ku protein [Streptomyces microflavus]|uniref:Ku protein n=1 Tax=Streptomyces microflavus TaxID=1919 RepID=UPI0033AF88A4
MPRPLWVGAISFGLVTIPVKIVSATEDHDVHFHRVHLAEMCRVRTRKVCELDGEVVSQDEIGKGYEVSRDETVAVTDEELEQMPLPTAKAKAIEIVAFVDASAEGPPHHRSARELRLERPSPVGGQRGYCLEALRQSCLIPWPGECSVVRGARPPARRRTASERHSPQVGTPPTGRHRPPDTSTRLVKAC